MRAIAALCAGLSASSLHRSYARRRHADRDVQATGQWPAALVDGRQLLVAGAVTDAAVSVNGVTIGGWAVRQNSVRLAL